MHCPKCYKAFKQNAWLTLLKELIRNYYYIIKYMRFPNTLILIFAYFLVSKNLDVFNDYFRFMLVGSCRINLRHWSIFHQNVAFC